MERSEVIIYYNSIHSNRIGVVTTHAAGAGCDSQYRDRETQQPLSVWGADSGVHRIEAGLTFNARRQDALYRNE